VLLLEAGSDWRVDEAPWEVRTPNPIPIIHSREYQEKWQWRANNFDRQIRIRVIPTAA
jgi:hypothetical protein